MKFWKINKKKKKLLCGRIIEEPIVTSVVNSGFPAGEKNNNRLYNIVAADDNNVLMEGCCSELKLFDLQGNLHLTVNITCFSVFLCMFNKHVVYSGIKAVRMMYNTAAVMTMFTTGDWEPYGVTSTASRNLLVCLRKDDQSKVVRYSSTGTVLQEIQYNSQC